MSLSLSALSKVTRMAHELITGEMILDEDQLQHMAYMDGMLTADLVGPIRLNADTWAQLCYGPATAGGEPGMVAALLALDRMRAGQILRKLRAAEHDYVPDVLDVPDEAMVLARAREWATGFAAVVRQSLHLWTPAELDPRCKLALITVASLLEDRNGKSIDLGMSEEDGAVLRKHCAPRLGEAAYTLYQHWHGEDGALRPLRNPLARVGRNDPCPCGSGKKHKKCCLH